MQIGDLVIVKEEYLGIVVKVIDDARYKEGILHLKVYMFEHNNAAWFNAPSLTVLSPSP